MPFIIYPQADNKLAVIIPTGDVNDCIKDVPEGVPHAIVESIDGVDNDYFDGFVYADGEAVADITRVKAIHLNKWRSARAPKLAALDIAYSRADEAGDSAKKSEVAGQKQALRDVTKTALPDTLPEIKAVWPEILT